MDIINVGIFTNDLLFGVALGNKLAYFQPEFLIYIGSHDELESREKTHGMDLVLMDEPIDNCPKHYVELVELRGSAVENDEISLYKVFKYGNVKEMALKLLYIYGHISGHRQISIKSMPGRIIFFCSPYGGSGVTSISRAVAEEISRFMDKSVLYLTLEEIQEPEENSEIRSLGEYLYHLQINSHMVNYIESFLIQERYGFERFKKAGGRNPLKELDGEEFLNFIHNIAGTARHDIILIDSGQDFSESIIKLMRFCHRICVVESDFRDSLKNEILEAYLENKIGDGFESKLIKALNNCSYDECLDENSGSLPAITSNMVEIDYDPHSFHLMGVKGQASIDLDFGKGIKKLAKMII